MRGRFDRTMSDPIVVDVIEGGSRDFRPTQRQKNEADGLALMRLARELREHWVDQDVPLGVLDDLATVERVGRWLATAQVIDGDKLGFRVTGLL